MTGTWKMGLRILCLAFCLVSMLCLLQPVAAVSVAEEAPRTTTAIVRNQASDSGYPIGQMVNGTKLNILGKKRNYYKIDCYDMKGYILKSQVEQRGEEYYVNCQERTSGTAYITYSDYDTVLNQRKNLMRLAKEQLGTRYRYGGARPGGFDCSGFTSFVMNSNGLDIHRTASTQLQDGVIIPCEALQVGDLVFFRERGSKYPATHVGIYVGDNMMIHSARRGVVYESLDSDYYKDNYLCARRVLHPDPVLVAESPENRSAAVGLSVDSITGRTARCCN